MKVFRKRIIVYVLFGILILGSLAYLGLSIYFMDHFFWKTRINGKDFSGLDTQQAEDWLMSEQSGALPLKLVLKDGTVETVTMNQLGGRYEVRQEVLKVKRQQNGFCWPRMLMEEEGYALKLQVVFDEAASRKGLEELACMQNMQEPEVAYIAFHKEGYTIVEEVEGNSIDGPKFLQAVGESFAEMRPFLNLQAADCYRKPNIRKDDEALVNASDKLDVWLKTKAVYEIGEEDMVVDAGLIKDWITVSEEGVLLSEEKIAAYVDAMADTYDDNMQKRVFHSTLRGRMVLSDKKHKWLIDREAEKAALIQCVTEGGAFQREPFYQHLAGEEYASAIGDTYVEVDIGAQHLWVYVEGEAVLDTDIVTGNTGLGRGTPGIVGFVYAKQKNRILRGDNYASFVKYWMPFYRGYGLHDANWRGAFGGNIYKYSGSHGCVNLPPSVAPKVYELVKVGTPVVTFY